MFLQSGILALLLWNMGGQTDNPFPKNLAITFAASSLLNFIHVMVTVEWSGPLLSIAQSAAVLRPGTWPPAVHVLPIGVGCAIWIMRSKRRRTRWFLPGLIA